MNNSAYAALINAYRAVAPVALGITTPEAEEAIAAAQVVGANDDDPEAGTWFALLQAVEEHFSEWDADQVAEKCANVAEITLP